MDLSDLALAIVIASLACIPLGVSLWALLDAARRPSWAWAMTDRHQVVWIALILFATFTLVGGLLVASWYLARIRPVIAAAEDGPLPAP